MRLQRVWALVEAEYSAEPVNFLQVDLSFAPPPPSRTWTSVPWGQSTCPNPCYKKPYTEGRKKAFQTPVPVGKLLQTLTLCKVVSKRDEEGTLQALPATSQLRFSFYSAWQPLRRSHVSHSMY